MEDENINLEIKQRNMKRNMKIIAIPTLIFGIALIAIPILMPSYSVVKIFEIPVKVMNAGILILIIGILSAYSVWK